MLQLVIFESIKNNQRIAARKKEPPQLGLEDIIKQNQDRLNELTPIRNQKIALLNLSEGDKANFKFSAWSP